MCDLQVLDEIHRQPVSLSLSMVSLPAPESVVDSLPLKSHKKVETAEGSEAEQYDSCHITVIYDYMCVCVCVCVGVGLGVGVCVCVCVCVCIC